MSFSGRIWLCRIVQFNSDTGQNWLGRRERAAAQHSDLRFSRGQSNLCGEKGWIAIERLHGGYNRDFAAPNYIVGI